ncbi:LysM peptidoglycan-binding domain-containing protein [Kineococcus sp. SYSU DK006]|uniref:LysM peptidoglycan-binding domain-containing protein n=1 Tax=Kineococcus sp. SYSU DK006 TaxID=3383127 RepID=UPI003D7DE8D1
MTTAVGALLAAVPAAAGAGALWLGSPALRTAAAGTPGTGDLLVAGCAVLAALVLGWLALGTVLAALDEVRAAAPGRRPARRTPGVPAPVRRLVAVAVGLLLGSTALSAGAAERGGGAALPDPGWAASAPADPGAAPAPVDAVDPGWAALTEHPQVAAPGPRAGDLPRLPGGTREGAAPAEVVVQRGDTLWSLARARCGAQAGPGEVLRQLHLLHEANADVIGDDPDVLHPGQVLRLP